MSDGYPTTPRMDQRFLEAFLTPRATRLAGYDLYPWCLKHRLWLTALGHPLLTGDRECYPADILFFAKVCSETPGPDKVGLVDRWRAAKLCRKGELHRAVTAAREHMRQDCWPRFWDKKDEDGAGGRNRGMPWALGVVINLIRSGLSLEDALNLPECQAIWLSSASSMQQGASLDYLTSEDEDLLDELQRVKATAPHEKT
jgi:hypothetical protein